MADTLFYTDQPHLDRIVLSPEESHHAIKVSRLNVGDSIFLTDGVGTIVEGLVRTNRRVCEVEVVKRSFEEKKSSGLHLAFPSLKSTDRLTLVLEKAVELAVDTILLFTSENSVKRIPGNDKVMRKLIAGLKQTKSAYLPQLFTAHGISEALDHCQNKTPDLPVYFGHCQSDSNKLSLSEVGLPGWLFIGPESDFSPNEISNFKARNAQSLHLGPNRLRAETAALLSMSYAYQSELGNIAK
jgi:16S rRNA (uracil1498-N3)-methyltransferase